MDKYGVTAAPSANLVSSPTWREYLLDLSNNWSLTSAAIVIMVPWSVFLGYVMYYWFFKRPAKQERAALGPFLSFYTLLTDGTTAGFDKRLMSVFHPALFKDGNVEKGILRAMARCLTATFGPVERVPRETVVLKRDGMQVNCVALVDFAKKQQVTCQLSWVRRMASARSLQAQEKEGVKLPGRRFSPEEVVDGIGMAPLGTFHVTSFHIEQHSSGKRSQQLDVLRYLKVEEFEYFAESFVERLFAKPPVAAVKMMLPALQEKYLADGAKGLEGSIQKVVSSAGGLGARDEVDATLVEEELVKSASGPAGNGAATGTAIDGIDMTFHVSGVTRDLEVQLRFTIVGMRCFVTRYEIRLLPDRHMQVLLDHDTGSTTIIN